MKTTDLDFIKMCEKVAILTDENDHTGAKKVIADFFGLNNFSKIFGYIEQIHRIDGYLCSELNELRRRKGIEMMLHICDKFGNEIEEKISNNL